VDEVGWTPRLLTLDEVAVYLNLTHWQAYELVRSGTLPAIKGRKRRHVEGRSERP
jgi:excisionase family DNA binding protein